MTLRDWFGNLQEAGETPSLVSLALFAAVFLPSIFLVGLVGPWLDMIRDAVAVLSTEMKIAGMTVFILGLMALARIFVLLFGDKDGAA
ncbi:hypothetical protein [Maricaulis parjimensis]|uniref:hypothetical protein n=1 Tax=Maricaulis parjimensis TaxID=144023 RepID=UPI0019398F59|nr:hypothetical protein [Maricaulis parjimensis]